MPYERETCSARNWWIACLLIAQAVIFLGSMTEFSQLSVFCSVPRNGMPQFVQWGHTAYLVLFIIGLAGLFVRRIGLFYLVALPLALGFLPFQIWALDAGYFYCDGP